jgi:DNA-binding ferritin-like protein
MAVLMTHAENAHWTFEGMEFNGLHQLFDEIAETLEASMGAPPPDSQGPSVQ